METVYRTRDGKEFKRAGWAMRHEHEIAKEKAHKKAPLTPRQQEVLNAIVDFRAKNGYSPTQLDLAKILGVSHVAVLFNIRELVAKGALKSVAKKAIQIAKENPYTQRQLAVLNAFVANPMACQKQVADIMGISAPSLHQHIESLLAMKAIKVVPSQDSLKTTVVVLDPEITNRVAQTA